VATTGIVGDVVAQVGGEVIELTVLMSPGQDPHSFEPSANDLTAAVRSQVIFVNGWDLEEGLVNDLANVAEGSLLIPVSANIDPLPFGRVSQGDAEQDVDPHVWLDPHNVLQWIDNVEQVLSALDPRNQAVYQQNAVDYRAEISKLIVYFDEQVSSIQQAQRKIVTNHEALAYFADVYGFEIIGTVIPGASTLAEPSANDLASLVKLMEAEGVCTIFAETTANEQLAETVAGELSHCEAVQVISLYTGALGAEKMLDSYLEVMRANIEKIAAGLQLDD